MLIYAIITITLALILYSVGVWSEKIQGQLRSWHLVCFWIGFVFDTTGTTLMSKIAGKFILNLHGISGLLAIVFMFAHAFWATFILIQKNPEKLKNFHKFSIFMWIVWLIPFISGAAFGMAK